MTSSSTFTPALDLLDALDEIQREQLFDPISDDSHIQEILRSFQQTRTLQNPERQLLDVWFAKDNADRPLGVALVTDECIRGSWHKVVNLFVQPQARGQGIGLHLLEPVLIRHKKIHGHYTPESINLYEALGIPDFFKKRSEWVSSREIEQRHTDMHMEHALSKARAARLATPQYVGLSSDLMEALAAPIGMDRADTRHTRRRRR